MSSNGRFPSEADGTIQAQFRELADVVGQAHDCARGNNIGEGALAASLRSCIHRVRAAERSSYRPACMGFFGASQVGKSFLISELAKGNDEKLWIEDPEKSRGLLPKPEKPWVRNPDESGGHIDFRKYINVDEGRETTAVVCRFMRSPLSVPVRNDTFVAQLLSHEDILRSLVKGFVHECHLDGTDGTPEEMINRTLTGSVTGSGPRSPFVQELEETWRYVERYHESHSYYRAILNGQIIDRLSKVTDIPDRFAKCQAASLLWGGTAFPAVNDVYARLRNRLEQIRFAPNIEIQSTTVASGKSGPVYVQQLQGLLSDDNTTTVLVRPTQGEPFEAQLTCPELCALIAELHLPVTRLRGEVESDVLHQGHILDFPGAEPMRGEYGFGRRELSGPDGPAAAGLMLKRGKLTYLFEGYCREREVTVLVLCVTLGEFKAFQLPAQVCEWITTRYPGYPKLDQTEAQNPALFIAVTKFDQFLRPIASAEEGKADRWNAFFQGLANYLEGKAEHKWFTQWPTPRETRPFQPFNNTYWVWNPLFAPASTFLQSLPRHARQYQDSAAVRNHVAECERKWSEAVPPDRTGVPLLLRALRAKFSADLKRAELKSELNAIASVLAEHIRQHYIPEECQERKNRSRQAAEHLLSEIERNAKSMTFGPLLHILCLPPRMVDELLNELDTINPAVDDFVDGLVQRWHGHMLDLLRDPETPETVRVGGGALSRLVKELADHARQNSLRERLVRDLDYFFNHAFPLITFRNPIRQVCAKVWSDFVIDLGEPLVVPPMPTLPPKRSGRRPFLRFLEHWRKRLPKVYEGNAGGLPEVKAWNAELGGFLERLNKLQASASGVGGGGA